MVLWCGRLSSDANATLAIICNYDMGLMGGSKSGSVEGRSCPTTAIFNTTPDCVPLTKG